MKLIQEFKEFAVKGNMIDMAIGIIIGASFNKVIEVLVKKVLLPPLSLLSDGINLESKKIILRESQTNSEGVFLIEEVGYGEYKKEYICYTCPGSSFPGKIGFARGVENDYIETFIDFN